MSISVREGRTVLHGMLFGAAFLLAFAGGFAGLYSLRPEWVTAEGIKERMLRLKVGLWSMALIAWATVISGSYIVYPWYRLNAPTSAKSILLANPNPAAWH